MSEDYGPLHGLAFMFLTLSHQGDGEITEEEMVQLRRLVNKYSYESASLRQQGLVAIDDNVDQTLNEVSIWYDRALNGGKEGVFRQFSVIAGQTPNMFDKEYLYRIYGELESVAKADGEITAGEQALLDKTADVWDLGDIAEGTKLYEEKYGKNIEGSTLSWPYGEYEPLHADIFMFTTLSVIGDGILSDEETAVVRQRITSLQGNRGIDDQYINEAFHIASIWFNDVLNSQGQDKAIEAFHEIGIEVAKINNYNPNVLNLKMQLFRDCCAADGEITEVEKKLLDDLADSWKMSKDWTKRLPRYKAFSDYEEKDIECPLEFFNPLSDYFRVCFGIGVYSFAHEGSSMHLKDGNVYMFTGHPDADDDHELPHEKELMLILDDKASDSEYAGDLYGDIRRSWIHNIHSSYIMSSDPDNPDDFNENSFMLSVDDLLAGVNIATTSPGKPSDKSLINTVYSLLVECARHNRGSEEGLYENVVLKLQQIKDKWGITEDIKISDKVLPNPEFDPGGDDDDDDDWDDDDDEDDDDDDDTYFANDCVCGETAKLTGDLLQSYIDDNMDYECDECEREIDPSFGWYSITLDEFIED